MDTRNTQADTLDVSMNADVAETEKEMKITSNNQFNITILN